MSRSVPKNGRWKRTRPRIHATLRWRTSSCHACWPGCVGRSCPREPTESLPPNIRISALQLNGQNRSMLTVFVPPEPGKTLSVEEERFATRFPLKNFPLTAPPRMGITEMRPSNVVVFAGAPPISMLIVRTDLVLGCRYTPSVVLLVDNAPATVARNRRRCIFESGSIIL